MSPYRWRAMSAADLTDVQAIAETVHIEHPERPAVFAERLRLHAAGCFVLVDADARVVGYAVAHPWAGPPPALDTLLQVLPAEPTTFYVHDVALLPSARGQKLAADILARLLDRARRQRLPSLSLIAVGGTAPLWHRLGFRASPDGPGAAKLASYGAGAVHMIRPV